MWPFFRHRADGNDKSAGALHETRRPLSFAAFVEGMGDFADLRTHDTALKFWLPSPAAEALRDFCARNGDSRSEALRQFFAQHCYGVYAFQLMIEQKPDLFRDPARPLFSRTISAGYQKKRSETYWVPELGKNVVPLKVWVPRRILGDLEALAGHVNLNLSEYVRGIIIARLLGHGTLPMRAGMLEAAPLPSVEDWCNDQTVPMREVTRDELVAMGWDEHLAA